nr:MAG TPA: hypothetical protein [Bacteriophage sp.]
MLKAFDNTDVSFANYFSTSDNPCIIRDNAVNF